MTTPTINNTKDLVFELYCACPMTGANQPILEAAKRWLQAEDEKPSTPQPKPEVPSTDFEIESGIPIVRRRASSGSKYPFAELEIGQSFHIEGGTPGRLLGSSQYWAEKLDRKFAIRSTERGIRIWRTA